MEEITGPIIAITLVLCAVFVPCCFIGGITGQFFRQFAVTIAVSTIISAINALTMTPVAGRADLQDRGRASHGHELKREALPWWIFGVLGGLLAVWYGPDLPGRPVRPAAPSAGAGETRSLRLDVLGDHRRLFRSRRAGRRADRLVDHPAGERRAGLAVPGLQPALRRGDRRATAGRSASCCASASSCLLVYGGLLVLTYWVFQHAPDGLHSAAGPGPADRQRPVARLGVAAAHQGGHGAGRRDRPRNAGRGAHGRHRGNVVPAAGQQPPTSARCSSSSTRSTSGRAPGLRADGDHGQAAPECGKRGQGRRWSPCTEFVADPGPRRRRRLQAHGRGPRRPRAGGPCRARPTSWSRKLQDAARPGRRVRPQFRSNTPQLFLDIDRTKAAALGVSLDDVNQTLAMYLGSLYVNSFNEFGRHWQVTVQAEGDLPQPGRGHQPVPGPQQVGADGPAGHAGQRHARSAARSSSRATTSTPPRRSPATCRPGVSSGEAIDDDRPHGRRDAAAVDEGGVDRADVHADPGGQHRRCTSSRWRSSASSWPWRRCTRAGRCRWRSSWWCRCACSARVAGVLVTRPRRQHLRADRPGRAGGPGVQERDPDRRVRQAAAPGGPVAATRRRGRRPGCGCGRS